MTAAEKRQKRCRNILKNSGITVLFLSVSCLVSYLLHDFRPDAAGNSNVAMVFILAIFLIARFTDGYWYGIIASLVGVLGVNYVFTYPYMEFNFTLTGYPISIICMLLVSLTTSSMMTEVKKVRNGRWRRKERRCGATCSGPFLTTCGLPDGHPGHGNAAGGK